MVQYPKNWTKESVEKFVTQESQQKDREEFEATHVPINRIKVTTNRVTDWAAKEDRFISEVEFRDAVLDSNLQADNRMFFVAGETGSGKSELCQWMDYEIKDRYQDVSNDEFRHIPIHIPREVREPREVFQRLAKYVDENTLDEAKNLADLPMEGVHEKTLGEITLQFSNTQISTIELVRDDEFRSAVRDNLNSFIDAYDDPSEEKKFEPISEHKLEALIERYPGVRDEHADQPADVVTVLYNQVLSAAKNAIKDMLFLGDLKSTLSQINERFLEENKRPVLIIEDLAAFTIFQHEILSFFSDLGNANWDVVVGITTGLEQNLVEGRRADIASEETINDRIKARLALTEQTDEGSKTLFLEQENIHIKLARNYLEAIKADSETEYEPQLPVSESELNDIFGEGLYPFNESFLTKIYENLEQEEDDQRKQTPRVYLKFVLEGLLTNKNPPFQHADLLKQLGTIDTPISSDYHEEDRNLIKWYGQRDGDWYKVDERVAKVFDVESDGEAPIVEPHHICGTCGAVMVEQNNGALVCEHCETICEECGAVMERHGDFWICTGDSEHKQPVGGHLELFQKRQQELLDWRGESKPFRQTSQIEEGAESVIRFFHDSPTSLRHEACLSDDAAAIWWNKGGRHVPIHVDNNDEPDYSKIELTRSLPEKLLLDLLRIGVFDKSIEEQIENGSIDAQLLRDWSDSAVSSLKSDLETDIRERFNGDIDDIAVFGKYLLNVVSGTSSEYTPKALAQPVNTEHINAAACPPELDANLKKLADNADTLLGLFHARFHIRSSMVNYRRLRHHVEKKSREEVMNSIANIGNGITGFKIGPRKSDTSDLTEFLRSTAHLNLRGYARNIREYKGTYESDKQDRIKEVQRLHEGVQGLDDASNIDFEAIDDAYAQSSEPKPQVVTDIQNISESRLDDFIGMLEETKTGFKKASGVWEFLDAYHSFARLRYIRFPDEYKQLHEFTVELDSLESALEEQIEEYESRLGEVEPELTNYNRLQKSISQFRESIEADVGKAAPEVGYSSGGGK